MSNFAIISKLVSAGTTEPVNFDFSSYGEIGAVTWGISNLTLMESDYEGFGGAQQPLQDLVVSITPAGGGLGFNYIDLDVSITLTDSVDNASSVLVTVFAYIGNENPEGIALNYNIGVNTQLGPQPSLIPLPSYPSAAAGFLAGLSFTSSDSSPALGFGASAGVALSPLYPLNKPQALAVGSGVCLFTNENPPTSTVDVGSVIFAGNQSVTDQQLVVGTYVDCMPWGVVSSGGSVSGQHTVTIPTPPLKQVAVFLQSFFVQFQISDWSAITVTPDFSAAGIGASSFAYDSASAGITFESTIYMGSSYPNENAGWGTGGGAYALSASANYVYIGILDN